MVHWLLVAGVLAGGVSGKSTYPDGNYSDAAGAAPRCSRCHGGEVNPSGASLLITSSAAVVAAGATVNVTVTKSGFKATPWKPGISLHIVEGSDTTAGGARRAPQEFGWAVTNSPHANTFNFVRLLDPELPTNSFTWVLKAPARPGTYRFSAAAYYNDGNKIVASDGTVRAGEKAITVTPASENVKPTLTAVSALYGIYVFLKFSEPLDSASAVTAANYALTEISTQTKAAVVKAALSRDATVVTLTAAAPLSGTAHSVTVTNVKDFAAVPNTIATALKNFTPDLSTPYRIYAEYSQDVNAARVEQFDEFEVLGMDNFGVANRVNLAFTLPSGAADILSNVPFQKARLRLRQQGSPAGPCQSQTWEAYLLSPAGSVGNYLAVDSSFAGYNPSSSPVSSLNAAVTQVDSGLPAFTFTWDVTQSFRQAYQGAQRHFYLRLTLKNEAAPAGAAFYGADARDPAFRPVIELLPDSNIAVERTIRRVSGEAMILPNPCGSAAKVYLPRHAEGASISIHDICGRVIFRRVYEGRAALPLPDLRPGIYLLSVRSGQFFSQKRFVRN